MDVFNPEKKSDRQRKKRFYNTIRHQIEFYLGDVNLSKDRFFGKLLEQSPYIDVDVILQCNKIKKLTTDAKDIVKALKKSQFLSVNEDGTKIFRTVPVETVANADDCTIYVEDLPLEADHEWLKNVFSTYGEVVYVSVPHYRTSHKIKGFAFVQFDTPENTKKAIDAFRSVNSCLSSSMEPTHLRSVQTYEGDKEIVIRKDDVVKVENIKCVKIKSDTTEKNSNENETADMQKSQIREPATETTLVEENDEPLKKKRKKNKYNKLVKETVGSGVDTSKTEAMAYENAVSTETDEEVIKIKSDPPRENISESVEITETKPNTIEKNTSHTSDGEDCENEFNEKQTSKRKRRKKKLEQIQTYGMQILSKQDWKKLRNKYLEEQKKKMHHLKQQLRKASIKHLEKYKSNQKSDDEKEETMEAEESHPLECRVKFTPGVIVKLNLDQPIKDVKLFKTEVKRYADVEYIDVNENNTEAYFRCSSNELANQVMVLNKWPNMVILHGDEELAYWEKIKRDRKEKFDNKIKCNTRGKNKLIKKVESALATHIKFPD